MKTILEILTPLADWSEPRTLKGNPFRLGCCLEPVADSEEIKRAWSGVPLPSGLVEFWELWRTATLFADVDYGQWGLILLSPSDSATRTAKEHSLRPKAFQLLDLVVGEFIGDQELLVIDNTGAVLIALPLDDREDWYRAADSLPQFLRRYVAQNGMKYWEAESRKQK